MYDQFGGVSHDGVLGFLGSKSDLKGKDRQEKPSWGRKEFIVVKTTTKQACFSVQVKNGIMNKLLLSLIQLQALVGFSLGR